MSRWKKLNAWPGYLQRMSAAELREELAFWRRHATRMSHRAAQKEVQKRIRTVEKVLQEKVDAQASPPAG